MIRTVGLGCLKDLAQRIEEKNRLLRATGPKNMRPYSSPIQGDTKPTETFPTRSVLLNQRNSGNRREKRLTKAEIQERRRRGLCFHCDEKFTVGYRCKREFNILLVNDDEIDMVEDDQDVMDLRDNFPSLTEKVQISLNSLIGLTIPGTMKLRGEIRGQEVVVLINCGATHNFISWDLVQQMGISLSDTSGFNVETGTGEAVQGKGICKDVVLTLQELTIVESFLPIELGSKDVVLGMQWLGRVRRMGVDWNKLEMGISLGSTRVVLKGDSNRTLTQ